jgi:iron(III) transport system permease protein
VARASRDFLPAAMLAAAAAASLAIVLHLGVILWLSLSQSAPGAPAIYGFANFAQVFGDARTYAVFANTLEFSLVSLAIALGFGIPAAWLAERTDLRGKSLLFTAMTVGLLIPDFAAAMGWLFLLHPRIGLLNLWLRQLFGLHAAPFDVLTIGGMGWVQGLNLAPLAFIMTAAVFRSLDPALEEAAATCAGPIASLRRVTLPLAWPGILAAALYIFTIGFAAFDVPAIVGWSARIFTFSTYLYLLLNPQDVLPRYGAAAALSTSVMALAALLSWWYGAMQRRSRRFAVVTGKAYRPRLKPLGRGGGLAAWAFLGTYLGLSKLVPLALLAWASLLPFFQLPSARALKTASFAHYRALPWDLALTGLGNTAILMLLTPTVTLALSLAFSWVVLRSRVPWRGAFDFVAFLPHAVPSIIFGVGALIVALYVVERIVPVYGTIWILLMVFTLTRLSYGTRMTNSGLIQISTELEESAQVAGAGTWGTLLRVLLPLLKPTLAYAWLWIALLTFRELTLAVVLSTSGNLTLPVVIWSLWLGGGFGQASALAMIMLLLMLPATALYWPLVRRQGLLAP